MATFGLPDRTGIVSANTAEAVCLRPQIRFACCNVIEIERNFDASVKAGATDVSNLRPET
jgi:hypothetical protein